MSARDQLSEIAQRRFDIELKRMIGLHGEERGREKTEFMARRWSKTEKKLEPPNLAAIWTYWRRGCKPACIV